jgi:hypothetical protein
LEFPRLIQTVISVTRHITNPKTLFMLISLMKIGRSVKENSLNLNILFLNISKEHTRKKYSIVKAVRTSLDLWLRISKNN